MSRRVDPPAIAPAGETDLPTLAELMAGAPLLRRYGTTRDSALAALSRAREAGDVLLIARPADGPPAGVVWVVPSRALTGGAYLRLLLVAPGWQRLGVGARLLQAAETEAAGRANHMCLLVTTDNVEARGFYERRGYRYVGDLPGLAAPAIDEALYWKVLRPHGSRLPV